MPIKQRLWYSGLVASIENVDFLSILIPSASLEVVDTYKYLGCVLSSDLCNVKDMERCRAACNKSFGFLFRIFRSVDLEILHSPFNSFCTSFYGCELWLNRKKCSFKQVSVSYHAALKEMLQVPRFYINHFVCSIFNALTFENLVNFRTMRFHKWMESCSSQLLQNA